MRWTTLDYVRTVRNCLVVAFLLGSCPAFADESRNDAPRPVPPQIDKPAPDLEPGHDEERGPRSEGEVYALRTPILEKEIDAIDSSYRNWVERIRGGTADKRIMRLHHFYRSRLDPFDRPIPTDWRQDVHRRLRDREAGDAAAALFRQRRSESAQAPLRGDVPLPPADAFGRAHDINRGSEPPAPLTLAGVSASGVWIPVGPFTIPGRKTGLAQPPGQPDTLYATAGDGGLWRTSDAGQTWDPLSDFEITLSAGSVLVDPTDPDKLYLGTGEGNGAIDNYPGVGVLRSVDRGRTWAASNNFSSSVRMMALHPDIPNRIFAAGDDGCYVSTDSGATFTRLVNGPGSSVADVKIRPDDPDAVFCSTWSSSSAGDIYRSLDGGATFTVLSSGLPTPQSTGRVVLAISPSNPNLMIAGISIDGGEIYKSTNGGDDWVYGGITGFCSSQCWYDIAVAIDPADPNVLYAGGVNSWSSSNGGSGWVQISSSAGGRGAANYVHVDHHAILAPRAGEVIIAGDGGIFHSTDYGANWTEWSQGMDTTQYYGICRHPGQTGWAFGGTQDNGSHRKQPGDNPEWAHVLGGDGGMCMTGPDGTDIVIGEFQNHNMRRSTNNGNNWSSANGGIDSGEPSPWVGIMAADPSDRNNLWTGTDRLYRSTDALATDWVAFSPDLYGGNSVSAIEVAPNNGQFLYFGFGGGGLFLGSGVLSSVPSWRDARVPGMPTRTVRRIRSHPDDYRIAYVVFGGFGNGKIWKTVDRAASWTDHTGNLPDVPVNDLLIDADNPGTLLAATDLGVFRTDDDGLTWYGFSNGLPTTASIQFTHDRASDTVRLGTHGRSMWEWQAASDSPVAVPDGLNVPGTALSVDKLGSSQMRVHWDVRECTAQNYNLLYGDLPGVSGRAYTGASCGIGNSGQADVNLPATPSGNVFFIVASTDGAGTEGPHGLDHLGSPVAADGIGFCGVLSQDSLATCP